MSEVIHYTGKLICLEGNGPTDTIEEQCKRILGVNKLKSYYSSYVEQLMGDWYEDYAIYNGKLYRVVGLSKRNDHDDIFRIKKINGSDFEFELRYYNGGCSFNEAIEAAFRGHNV